MMSVLMERESLSKVFSKMPSQAFWTKAELVVFAYTSNVVMVGNNLLPFPELAIE